MINIKIKLFSETITLAYLPEQMRTTLYNEVLKLLNLVFPVCYMPALTSGKIYFKISTIVFCIIIVDFISD